MRPPCLWPPMPFLAREMKYRSTIARRCFIRRIYCVWQFSWLSIPYCSSVSSWMASSKCSRPGSDPQPHSCTICWKRCRGLVASESFLSSWLSPISPSFTISFHNFASPSSVKAACIEIHSECRCVLYNILARKYLYITFYPLVIKAWR